MKLLPPLNQITRFGATPKCSKVKVVDPSVVIPVELDVVKDAVRERWSKVIQQGDDPDFPKGSVNNRYKSRSEAVFGVCCELVRRGFSQEVVAGILINPALRISESVLERTDAVEYALKQAAAARRTVQQDWPDRNKDGAVRATMRNAMVGLQRQGLQFRFDTFRYAKFANGSALGDHNGEISDEATILLRGLILRKEGALISNP